MRVVEDRTEEMKAALIMFIRATGLKSNVMEITEGYEDLSYLEIVKKAHRSISLELIRELQKEKGVRASREHLCIYCESFTPEPWEDLSLDWAKAVPR